MPSLSQSRGVDITGEVAGVSPDTIGRRTDAGVHVATGDEWVLVPRVTTAGQYVNPASLPKALID